MNTRFLDACWGKPVDRTPVWLMRQAGRYLPDYMRVRSKCTFLELCKTPELAAEVTIQPVDILGVDAAILFSDILTPVEPMGMALDFVPGPVFEHPIRTMADVEKLRIPKMEQDVPYVLETLKILRRELATKVPLIGFGGAPFTLACYMVEGKGSKDFAALKKMMYAEPEIYAALMEKITTMDMEYLNAQIKAGAQAIQIFDTWGGMLSPADYERYVLPYTQRLINGLDRTNVPVIHFVKGAGTMLDNTVMAFGNELHDGNSHNPDPSMVILAGSGGGYFKTGRYLEYGPVNKGMSSRSATPNHSQLLVSLCQYMGLDLNQVGDPTIGPGGVLPRLR